MSDLQELTQKIIEFRDERDWKQFHKPKDLALSVLLEAAELAEHFQWKNDKEIQQYIKKNKAKIADEVADVLNYLILLSESVGVDIMKASYIKLKKNSKKYPIKKSKGRHTKYTEL